MDDQDRAGWLADKLHNGGDYGKEAAALLLAQAAELESLRRDAERYRWLRDDFSPMGLNIDGNHAWAYRRNATLKGPNLDAAIDAAMTGDAR